MARGAIMTRVRCLSIDGPGDGKGASRRGNVKRPRAVPARPLRTRSPSSSPSLSSSFALPSSSEACASTLPADTTRIEDTGLNSEIYLLGISHVSPDCAQKAADLVRSINPEHVMIELCEERTGLLVDDDDQPSLWWVASEMPCRLLGLPKDREWPSQEDLRAILKSGSVSKSKTVSFTKQDIEMDANVLMSTGLFRSVKPITPPADANSSPAFFFDSKEDKEQASILSQALPVRSIDFVVEPLDCPSVNSISLDVSGLDSTTAQEVESLAKSTEFQRLHEAAVRDTKTLPITVLLRYRRGLISLLNSNRKIENASLDVVLDGVETHHPVARVIARTGDFNSGISRAAPTIELRSSQSSSQSSRPNQLVSASASNAHANRSSASVGSVISRSFEKFQSEAGEKVGAKAGLAWRSVLGVLPECSNCTSLFLIDRPISETVDAMDKEIWNNAVVSRLPFFSAGGALASGAIAFLGSFTDHAIDPLVLVGGGVLGSLFCVALAMFGPVQQIYSLAKKSSEEIMEFTDDGSKQGSESDDEEDDLLLKWAPKSIIDDRDEYMFRHIATLARGTLPLAPAFIKAQDSDGRGCVRLYRSIRDQSRADPEQRTKVCVVVGEAHVQGIVKAWNREFER